MTPEAQWEYRVITVGSWRGLKPEAAEAALNELGQEGWEVVGTAPESSGSSKIVVIAKRPLTQAERRRRSYPS